MSQEKLRRFEEQVSPHLKSAYNLAQWLTRSHEDAEDVVQEAFLKAFSAFESLRNEDAKPWLLTIVRNTSMTWLKQNRKAGTIVGLEEVLQDPIERSPDPEERLLISCDREQVRQALSNCHWSFVKPLSCGKWKASLTKRSPRPRGLPSALSCRGFHVAAIG
jgi:RNA polymerase sigma factor (sigma-70 family)